MTAVEWLVDELNNHPAFQGQFFKEVFEQAKEIEKQQQGYSEEDMRKAFEYGLAYNTFSKILHSQFLRIKTFPYKGKSFLPRFSKSFYAKYYEIINFVRSYYHQHGYPHIV